MSFTLAPDVDAPKFLRAERFVVTDKHPVSGEPFVYKRECLMRADSVAVIIHHPQTNRTVWVEQRRIGPMLKEPQFANTFEPIAGMIDQGETPEEAARREVTEEGGFGVLSVEHLHTFYMCPGVSDERMHVFYATVDRTPEEGYGGLATESEVTRIHVLSQQQLDAAFEEGKLCTGHSLLTYQWLKLHAFRS